MQIAALIGFIIACYVGGYVSDVITTKRILREGGVIYPEQRLLSIIPGALIPPVGCIIVACACSQQLHWAVIAVGFGMGKYSPNLGIELLVICHANPFCLQSHSEPYMHLTLPLHMSLVAIQITLRSA